MTVRQADGLSSLFVLDFQCGEECWTLLSAESGIDINLILTEKKQ